MQVDATFELDTEGIAEAVAESDTLAEAIRTQVRTAVDEYDLRDTINDVVRYDLGLPDRDECETIARDVFSDELSDADLVDRLDAHDIARDVVEQHLAELELTDPRIPLLEERIASLEATIERLAQALVPELVPTQASDTPAPVACNDDPLLCDAIERAEADAAIAAWAAGF